MCDGGDDGRVHDLRGRRRGRTGRALVRRLLQRALVAHEAADEDGDDGDEGEDDEDG